MASLKVLIVDDEPFSLKLLGQVLRNLGIKDVVEADGGSAALACLEAMAD
jgi:CheY-like chemotaxis protein